MDPYWYVESLHQGKEDPFDAFLFEPPALLDFYSSDLPSCCFPDVKQQQVIADCDKHEPKPAIVQKKSSRGPSVAFSATAPLPATRPARASKPIPQRQQPAASKVPKCVPAPQPAQQQQQEQPLQQQQQQQQQGNSGSAEDTDYMSEEAEEASTGKGSKRSRAPEVDWKAIQDPEERRRQRRLAKNRLTAARSRERKKAILSELETKLQGFEADNARLQEMLAAMGKENKDLKQQLGQLCNPGSTSAAAAAAAAAAEGVPGSAEGDRGEKVTHSNNLPATSVKVLLALLLCMCLCKLTGEQLGLVLGGALPLLALAQLMENEGGLRALGESHGRRTKRRRTSASRASSSSKHNNDAAHNSYSPPRSTANDAPVAKHHSQQCSASQVFAGLAHFLAAFGQTAPQLCQGLQHLLHLRAACIPKGMFGPFNSSGGSTSIDGSSSMGQREDQGSGSGVGRVVAQGLPVQPACRVRSWQGPAGLLL